MVCKLEPSIILRSACATQHPPQMHRMLHPFKRLSALVLALCVVLHTASASDKCPNATLWRPTPGTSFYWDLTPNISTANILSSSAQVFDFDLFYITRDMVALIHALNRTLICYIDTAYEPFRTDAFKFLPSVLGKDMDGWPGQKV